MLSRCFDCLGLVVVLLLVNGRVDELSVARMRRHPGAGGIRRVYGGSVVGCGGCGCARAALVQDQRSVAVGGVWSTNAMLVAAAAATVCIVWNRGQFEVDSPDRREVVPRWWAGRWLDAPWEPVWRCLWRLILPGERIKLKRSIRQEGADCSLPASSPILASSS